jgi:glycosyltransferase involved in cell wall biosynthesis
MRVLFLHYGGFDSNSAIQAFHLGEEMTARGTEVAMCAQGPPERIETIGEPSFECVSYEDLDGLLRRWAGEPTETVICAWTPREKVRKATERAAEILDAPYVVHLEDNEEHLLSGSLRLPYEELARLPRTRLDRICTDDFIHPSHYPRLLAQASGVTGITEELSEFNFGDRPYRIARPGVDHERFSPDLEPAVSRGELGLGPDDFVIVYHGVGHFANHRELLSLYVAVKLLQRRGLPVKLVRLGTTRLAGVDPRSFRALMDDMVELGHVESWGEVPGYLALADAFVQPGAPDQFNRYRLPSKLPEFLAMGRQVILPACNLGNELVDGDDALLLRAGSALEIAARVEELIDAPELRHRLGERARAFALDRLSWRRNAVELADFYRSTLEAGREAAPA